jgi:hypothetical protein
MAIEALFDVLPAFAAVSPHVITTLRLWHLK